MIVAGLRGWKTDSPQRILRACQNPVIGPANAARFMTAASTLQRRARSAALNAPCAVKLSRIGTPLGFLDIGSLPVQLGMPNDYHPSALGTQPDRKIDNRYSDRGEAEPRSDARRAGQGPGCSGAALLISAPFLKQAQESRGHISTKAVSEEYNGLVLQKDLRPEPRGFWSCLFRR